MSRSTPPSQARTSGQPGRVSPEWTNVSPPKSKLGTKGSMAGWIGFAGIVMLIIGGLGFFQGLIALIEDEYYVATQAGFLVIDVTAWGWIMLFWGILLGLAGLALRGW
jgi:hypothetical protein